MPEGVRSDHQVVAAGRRKAVAAILAAAEGEFLATWRSPTRSYAQTVQESLSQVTVHGMAHITGGGLTENLPRVLPDNAAARIDTSSWQRPAVFDWLQQHGNVEDSEMYRTFNCGIGMVVAVAAADADKALEILNDNGEQAGRIGEIVTTEGDSPQVVLY